MMTFAVVYVLNGLFPYTGLAAIVFFPAIAPINGFIIVVGFFKTRNVRPLEFRLTWTAIAFMTVLIAIAAYPQESRPHVIKQIFYSIAAVKNYDNAPVSDLTLPRSVFNYGRYNSEVKGAHERFVVALFKYQNSALADSAWSAYQKDRWRAKKNDNLDIKDQLETGQDKLIWWTLEKLKK